MTEAQPVATGEIRNTPFGGLLASINSQKMTGSLVLAESPERLHCIAFRSGFPYKARLAEPIDLIGELLVEAGSLGREHLQSTLQQAQAVKSLFGQTAISLGLISPEALTQALVYQTLRRIARLFRLTTGTYGFYREDYLAAYGDANNPSVDPKAIISVGVRSYYDESRLAQMMLGLQEKLISTPSEFDEITGFRFNDSEFNVALALAVPRTVTELSQVSGEPLQIVHTVVHCLHMVGMLQVSDVTDAPSAATPPSEFENEPITTPFLPATTPPSESDHSPITTSTPQKSTTPPPSTPVSPPAPAASTQKLSPKPSAAPPTKGRPTPPSHAKSERRLEAEQLIEKGNDVTYFELLGVSPEVTDKELQKAYIKRARQFHPDRATGDLADLRPQMADLFARISVAHQTLKDPEKRKEYKASLAFKQDYASKDEESPLSEEDIVRKMLEADECYIKAKILLKRNKLDEAAEMVKIALEADPEQGDYAALDLWIKARKRRRNESVGDLIEGLKKAVAAVPKSEDAHFYLAQLLYQEGRFKEAFAEYLEVMKRNEHNIDAGRMVQILRRKLEERKKSHLGAKSGGGFFSSLFRDSKKK